MYQLGLGGLSLYILLDPRGECACKIWLDGEIECCGEGSWGAMAMAENLKFS